MVKIFEPNNDLQENVRKAYKFMRDSGIKVDAFIRREFSRRLEERLKDYQKDKELVRARREVHDCVYEVAISIMREYNKV